MTYNGWRNYETWAVNLHLNNDQRTYCYTLDLVEQAGQERDRVADVLKSYVTEDLVPDLGATLAADLLVDALGEVDWHELADAWLEGVKTA